MKKRITFWLAALMALTLAAGCTKSAAPPPAAAAPSAAPSTDNSAAATAAPAPAAQAGTTTVTILFDGSTVSDDTAVVSAANEYLAQIGSGLAVKPIWGTWGDFNDKATTALDTGDSNVDLFFTSSWSADEYASYAKKGAWVRLDDPADDLLATYGAGLKNALPQALWDGFTLDGAEGRGIYGVPGYKDYAQMYVWDVNNTRLAELGVDFDAIPWSADIFFAPEFGMVLAAAKAAYGADFYPLWIEAEPFGRSITSTDGEATQLLYYGFDPADPAKPAKPVIESRYHTDVYKKYLEKVREYYLAGYISPVLANIQQANDAFTTARLTGNYLISNVGYAYGYDKTASLERGIDARFPAMSKAIISTNSVQGSGYAISAYSKNKPAAMQFLNLWYTDPTLATLLAYGLEGTHYAKNADGTVVFDVEARNAYLPWRNGMGNIFILPPEESAGPDYWTEFKAYNEAGTPTALLGFQFDTDPVKNQIAALINVREEYMYALNVGAVDPAEKLPELQSKLDANGMDAVVAEVNRQVDAFFAGK